jgi:TonB family protein
LVSASGQTTNPDAAQALKIDSATGVKNLLTMPKVIYPAEAKQLHIQGKVELELTVSPKGEVVSERVISGPRALRQAAIEVYKNMKYRPFLHDGKPSIALVQATIIYEMEGDAMTPQDQRAGERFFPAHQNCENLRHQHAKNAIGACTEALTLSKSFSEGSQLEVRAVAYSDLAQLLVESGREREAASLGDEVVALVNATEKNSQAFVTAYATRAGTRAAIGDYSGSDADCTLAESSLRALAALEKSPVFIKMFRDELKGALTFHATVLEAEGNKKPAEALREEAGRL